MFGLIPPASRNSISAIASEYASCPVEHPGTQIRMGASAGLVFRICGKTLCLSISKVSGSRKKLVTLIRISW